MPKALFEIGTEELPASAAGGMCKSLQAEIMRGLLQAHITAADSDGNQLESRIFYSPRRLAVLLTNLPEATPQITENRRGPPLEKCYDRDGNPTRALLGFAHRQGVNVDELGKTESDKGIWMSYEYHHPAIAVAELLPDILVRAAQTLSRGRIMRWGQDEHSFLRPVRWLLALLDSDILPLTCFGIEASNLSAGHRVHAPEPLTIRSAGDWAEQLRQQGFVEPCFDQRRARIVEQARACAATVKEGRIQASEELIDELAMLVEWPVALLCRLDKKHLKLPREVVSATLEKHQRYLPVSDKTGQLLPCFVAVANLQSEDADMVIAGNERVVRPRLEDAAFFLQRDSEMVLTEACERLAGIQFHARLGSLADKSQRLQKIVLFLGEQLPGQMLDAPALERAAALCKMDQISLMVQEFPHLEGIMAGHYAQLAGEQETVCQTIAEQYLPHHAEGEMPLSREGAVLALADRLDSLCGLFLAGEKHSAERDPMGLRRMALTAARLILQLQIQLPPERLAAAALTQFAPDNAGKADKELHKKIGTFIWVRFESLMKAGGVSADLIAAAKPASPDLYTCQQRLIALQQFFADPQGDAAVAVLKRCHNLLRKNPTASTVAPTVPAERLPAERELDHALSRMSGAVASLTADGEYLQALRQGAEIAQPLALFFEQVMVMDEDGAKQAYRLHLLHRCREIFRELAQLYYIGDKKT